MSTAPTINAIPTTYNGVTFRSRLEARWAIFFDLLGVAWEYEPEGYTDGTTMYLPDFWIPEIDGFWEVKPTPEYDQAKIEMLVTVTKKRCLISFGAPTADYDDRIHEVMWQDAYDTGGWKQDADVGWDNFRMWCACPHCGKLGVEYSGYGGRICWTGCPQLPASIAWPGQTITDPVRIASYHEKSSGRQHDIGTAIARAKAYQFTTGTSPCGISRSGTVRVG